MTCLFHVRSDTSICPCVSTMRHAEMNVSVSKTVPLDLQSDSLASKGLDENLHGKRFYNDNLTMSTCNPQKKNTINPSIASSIPIRVMYNHPFIIDIADWCLCCLMDGLMFLRSHLLDKNEQRRSSIQLEIPTLYLWDPSHLGLRSPISPPPQRALIINAERHATRVSTEFGSDSLKILLVNSIHRWINTNRMFIVDTVSLCKPPNGIPRDIHLIARDQLPIVDGTWIVRFLNKLFILLPWQRGEWFLNQRMKEYRPHRIHDAM